MYGNQQKYSPNAGIQAGSATVAQLNECRIAAGPPDKSEIEHEMDRLTEAVNLLHLELDTLGVKLNPVIPPLPVGGENSANAPDPVRSPLGQAIHERSTGVGAAIVRVRNLRESIAL